MTLSCTFRYLKVTLAYRWRWGRHQLTAAVQVRWSVDIGTSRCLCAVRCWWWSYRRHRRPPAPSVPWPGARRCRRGTTGRWCCWDELRPDRRAWRASLPTPSCSLAPPWCTRSLQQLTTSACTRPVESHGRARGNSLAPLERKSLNFFFKTAHFGVLYIFERRRAPGVTYTPPTPTLDGPGVHSHQMCYLRLSPIPPSAPRSNLP